MSTKLFLGILVLLVFVGGYGYLRAGGASEPPVEQLSAEQADPLQRQLGAVTIEAKPSQLAVGKEGVINLSLNTHSVELDYDLAVISKIVDDLGTEYPVTKWIGGSGGHHLAGELTFGIISAKASTIMLTISGIEGEEAEFEFLTN